jgi:hypothetical protein
MKKNRQNVFQLGFIGGGLSSSIGQTHLLASQLDGRWKLVSGFFKKDNTQYAILNNRPVKVPI